MYHIIGKYYMVARAYKFTAKFNLETSIKKMYDTSSELQWCW